MLWLLRAERLYICHEGAVIDGVESFLQGKEFIVFAIETVGDRAIRMAADRLSVAQGYVCSFESGYKGVPETVEYFLLLPDSLFRLEFFVEPPGRILLISVP